MNIIKTSIAKPLVVSRKPMGRKFKIIFTAPAADIIKTLCALFINQALLDLLKICGVKECVQNLAFKVLKQGFKGFSCCLNTWESVNSSGQISQNILKTLEFCVKFI